MKFHHFSVLGLKNAKYTFLRFGAKYPRNHYVYKVLSNFPAGMIFIMISFCRKKILFAEFNFPDRFINHDLPENQYKEVGMDAESIEKKILSMISSKKIDIKKINNY